MRQMSLSIYTRLVHRIGRTKCHHCGSEHVRLSRASDGNALFFVYRCRACGHHFSEGLNLRTVMPYLFAFLTLVVLLVLLVTIIYFSNSHDETLSTILADQQSVHRR